MRVHKICVVFLIAGVAITAQGDELRSKAHTEYASRLWKHVTKSVDYRKWRESAPLTQLDFTPPADANAKSFLNVPAQSNSETKGAVVVTEHYGTDGETQTVTVCVRSHDGYDSDNNDWYWVHYLPDGTIVKSSVDRSRHAKRGFVTCEEDGRLWVFSTNSDQLAGFLKQGELAKHVIRPGAGPAGMTIKAPDAETIVAYTTAKKGFVTKVEDGRLWVFRPRSDELAQFENAGDLAKHVVRPGAGPQGMTIKAPDAETIDAYLTSKPGFVTKMDDGRLWVFREGSEELKQYETAGDLAKHVIRPGAGPGGLTVKSPDAETILAYLSARDGFATIVEDGRLWVFREGSSELEDFKKNGEPAKHVIRPAAGPGGVTVKGPDSETIDAYIRVAQRLN